MRNFKIKEVKGMFAVVSQDEEFMYGKWYKSLSAANKYLQKVKSCYQCQ